MSDQVKVVGVDRCRGQWITASLTQSVTDPAWQLAWQLGDHFLQVADPTAHVIGVDIPIGLADSGTRLADLEARAALPGWARSRVFLTPPREVVTRCGQLDNTAVQELSRSLTGGGVSKQALALAPAILDVDKALAASHHLQEVTIEVHPELSFAAMCGVPALPAKKTAQGVGQRVTALGRAWGFDVSQLLTHAPPGVAVDDCLDALAAAWSANRHRLGNATTWPAADNGQRGRHGRMAITA